MNATPAPTALDYAQVDWGADGVPRSPLYGDVYHAREGACGQSEAVFVQGNDLPRRWAAGGGRVVAELGFGSGLNFLHAAGRFLETAPAGATLDYVGFELAPWRPADAARLYAGEPLPARLCAAWLAQADTLQPGANRIVLAGGRLRLTLLLGPAERLLPQARFAAQAWFLDGFAPRCNADLWAPELWAAVAAASAPDATLATWCCAGAVRRGLQAQGFVLQRRPGYGGKRERLEGRLAPAAGAARAVPALAPEPASMPAPEAVDIVGAGLAGAWTARTLAEQGLEVHVHEAAPRPASDASGMPMLMVRPYARHRDTPTARFFWQAAPHACARIAELELPSWRPGPVWRAFGQEAPQWLSPAGWCDGAELCRVLLDHPRIHVYYGSVVPATHDNAAHRARPRIWCTAWPPADAGLAPYLRRIGGQQSAWARPQLGTQQPRVGDAVAAEAAGWLYFGASQRLDERATQARPEEALAYGARLPQPPTPADLARMRHWLGTRVQARDRLPLLGPLPWPQAAPPPGLVAGRAGVEDLPARAGAWLHLAHGSRGATAAPLCAQWLADRLLGRPWPLLAGEAAALDPRRFALRDWRRGRWPQVAEAAADGDPDADPDTDADADAGAGQAPARTAPAVPR